VATEPRVWGKRFTQEGAIERGLAAVEFGRLGAERGRSAIITALRLAHSAVAYLCLPRGLPIAITDRSARIECPIASANPLERHML
jgi:hypothetical protein